MSTHKFKTFYNYSDTVETTISITSPKIDVDYFDERPSSITKADILKQVIKNALLNRESHKFQMETEHFPGFYPYQAHYKAQKEKVLKEERKGGQITAISKYRLVERTMNDYQQTSNLNNVFLYTYKWYFEEHELFTSLLKQFKYPPPLGLSPIERKTFLDTMISKIQLKVLKFLKDWFKAYSHRLSENPNLVEAFLELLFLMVTHPDTGEWIKIPILQLLSDVESLTSKEESKFGRSALRIASLPEIFVSLSVLLGYSHLLAKQICILDIENLREVQVTEFYRKAWTKNDKHIKAPNLTHIAEMSTRLSRFTSYLVLMNKQKMARAMVYQFLIDLCDQLINLNDYNSAFAIYLGLATPAVQRLKDLFEPYISAIYKNSFENLEQLFTPTNNMANLRNKQENLSSPAVPYIGLHLSDIFFIEELPDYVDNEKSLINFNKFRLISEKTSNILSFKEPYGFHRVNNIINFIKGIPFISEEQIYDLSDKIIAQNQ